MDLNALGWDGGFAADFAPFAAAALDAARVVTEHRGGYRVVSVHGEVAAEVSGRFRHDAASPVEFPAVGDWVAVKSLPAEQKAVIQAVLPRRTKFSRAAPGKGGHEQILATNIDDVFIVASLGDELNPRRIERYLALAWKSGATPIVVLTKADLCDDIDAATERVAQIARDTAIHAISSVTGRGLAALRKRLKPARTVALLGPSGVGKSTLVNCWYGDELLATLPVREEDQKGRHTTTERQMVPLPNGALVIDTPGLRELHLFEAAHGVDDAFDDITALAVQCRFTDCHHESEPGCAIRAALESGALDRTRLESHRKLLREIAHAEAKGSKPAQADERRRNQSFSRTLRAVMKRKGRR